MCNKGIDVYYSLNQKRLPYGHTYLGDSIVVLTTGFKPLETQKWYMETELSGAVSKISIHVLSTQRLAEN